MKCVVDHDKCQGHAMCCSKAPEVFQLDEQGYNTMGEFTVSPEKEMLARLGADACPENAIRIIED
ncbi:MAG: ferredoxin [Spongiibacteraceae bacterium]